ncbi:MULTISPECIES: hypothetical protein [unclassified Nitratiruptor]|uniref:hypothetical protein n=1 Tax=unclassified Nitratiruptor TaxID=2624044 RepID=UPI00191645A0|nr:MULTISPECIES: hypothetical protein [unclassified Nitratiruptor]
MSRKLLRAAVHFLMGVFWALMFLSLLIVFTALYSVDLPTALIGSLLVFCFWLFWIVMLELVLIALDILQKLEYQKNEKAS